MYVDRLSMSIEHPQYFAMRNVPLPKVYILCFSIPVHSTSRIFVTAWKNVTLLTYLDMLPPVIGVPCTILTTISGQSSNLSQR